MSVEAYGSEEQREWRKADASVSKGRARGPQRRAPAPAAAPVSKPFADKPKLTFATTVTVWSIDPETDGGATFGESRAIIDKGEPVDIVSEVVKDDTAGQEETAKVEQTEEKVAPEPEAEPKELANVEVPKKTAEVPEPIQVDTEEKIEDGQVETKTKTLATSKSSSRNDWPTLNE